MRSTDYVDALRAKLDCKSDYELSKRLGIAHNVIGRYRKGGTFDNSFAVRTAELLGVDPFEVIGDMELERAKTDAQREHWAKVMQRFSRIAASAMIASFIGASTLAPTPVNASPVYIMLNDRRRKPHPA